MARPRNAGRKERVPFGAMRSKLAMDDATTKRYTEAGKVLRWINDTEGGNRVRAAQAGGYEFCTADGSEVAGTPDGSAPIEEGKMIRKHVGADENGKPKYAYLMAIDKEFYEEDAAKKEEVNRKVDEAIKGGKLAKGGTEEIPGQGKTFIKQVDYRPGG